MPWSIPCSRDPKIVAMHSTVFIYFWVTEILTYLAGWWFQPLWKILVRLDHHPNYWGK
jgi:hypothetical protein